MKTWKIWTDDGAIDFNKPDLVLNEDTCHDDEDAAVMAARILGDDNEYVELIIHEVEPNVWMKVEAENLGWQVSDKRKTTIEKISGGH